jgi:hypothetical protein
MQPLLVAERPQGDIEKPFRLHSEFQPAGDQPQAIDELCEGLERGERDQVLLGGHRLGQDVYDGACHCPHRAPGDHPGAEQDAGRAALRRTDG